MKLTGLDGESFSEQSGLKKLDWRKKFGVCRRDNSENSKGR